MVLEGLTFRGISIIEFGNAGGIGTYESAVFTDALAEQEYLDVAEKYKDCGFELRMFLKQRYIGKNT